MYMIYGGMWHVLYQLDDYVHEHGGASDRDTGMQCGRANGARHVSILVEDFHGELLVVR